MARPHHILLLTDSDERRAQWLLRLQDRVRISVDMQALQRGEADPPELIITDKLPITDSLGRAAPLVACGEIAVLGVGAQGPSDVVLPENCSVRELRLASHLLVEIVRLRRRLGQEIGKRRALRRMAYCDPLTGLPNRRKWDQDLAARVERLAATQPPAALGIVLLDLDLFKPLNDRLGHLAGDTLLRYAAQLLAAHVAPPHLAARVGGDEFGVLLSGVPPDDVPEIADGLRRSLEYRREGAGADEPPMTASAGVAVLRAPVRVRVVDALAATDQALLRAKTGGRNRSVTVLLPDGITVP